jgi:hypothetical protein
MAICHLAFESLMSFRDMLSKQLFWHKLQGALSTPMSQMIPVYMVYILLVTVKNADTFVTYWRGSLHCLKNPNQYTNKGQILTNLTPLALCQPFFIFKLDDGL